MNILLILGGWSSERDVSLNGGAVIEKALVSLGHCVTRFDPRASLDGLVQAAKKADFAFIALHGSPGEDGLIQAMLETAGCPYQGAGPSGSFLALNKAAAKEIFRERGLPVPDGVLLAQKPGPDWKPPFPFPVFVKGNTGGSSLGMERVASQADLPAALDRLFALGGEFIMEPEIKGVEVTCGVLGYLENGVQVPRALPPILIRPKAAEIFDYASKYTPGGAEEICPAPISEEATRAVQKLALEAHIALGLADYSRSDFIMRDDGSLMLLEVNTLPGMTATSLIPQEAAVVGLPFEDLIAHLIELGLADPKKNPANRHAG
ncbi:MAG: D-alanine--D-alanine ligase [Desulfovibrio sp.]